MYNYKIEITKTYLPRNTSKVWAVECVAHSAEAAERTVLSAVSCDKNAQYRYSTKSLGRKPAGLPKICPKSLCGSIKKASNREDNQRRYQQAKAKKAQEA